MSSSLLEVTPDQLTALRNEPDSIIRFMNAAENDTGLIARLDLDKAWHAIHFLLAGDAWGGKTPEAMAVFGGTELGDDLGYGPARYMTPDEVGAVATALSRISVDELRGRYIPEELEAAEIYPTGIWEEEGDEAIQWLMPWYEKLAVFYRSAAERGNPVLSYIS